MLDTELMTRARFLQSLLAPALTPLTVKPETPGIKTIIDANARGYVMKSARVFLEGRELTHCFRVTEYTDGTIKAECHKLKDGQPYSVRGPDKWEVAKEVLTGKGMVIIRIEGDTPSHGELRRAFEARETDLRRRERMERAIEEIRRGAMKTAAKGSC